MLVVTVVSLLFGIFTGRNMSRDYRFHEFSRLEYDARPARSPEVVGKIESIVGNEITIAKLEQPNFGKRKIDRDKWREHFELLTTEERVAEMEARLNAFTGENIIVAIPAGIEVTRRANPPQNEEEMRVLADAENLPVAEDMTISSAELAEGDYLTIWLDENVADKNVAEFINLMFTKNDVIP